MEETNLPNFKPHLSSRYFFLIVLYHLYYSNNVFFPNRRIEIDFESFQNGLFMFYFKRYIQLSVNHIFLNAQIPVISQNQASYWKQVTES